MLGEAQEIKTQGGDLYFVDALPGSRYTRVYNRNRGNEAPQTLEEFAAHDRVEYEGLGGPEWPNLGAIKAISDVHLQNDGTEDDFRAQLANITGLGS